MSKRKWWKNKETGEVVLQTGSNRQNMGTVFYRVRSGETLSETKQKFFSSHIEIKASGFPPLKPKEFKPRYAIYDRWSWGEAFVTEFEPGRFKVVMEDGQEVQLDEDVCKSFTRFFEDGSWRVVPEAEAMARLNKPVAPSRKILYEWLIPQDGILYGRTWATRFLPENSIPAKLYNWGFPFKTGRTVEVPE